MKITTKKERKPKPALKVKKEPKTGESSLNKAVKNVKEILKNETEAKAAIARKIRKESKNIKRPDDFIKVDEVKGKKLLKKGIKEKSEEKTKLERGVIYLGHIPHGFYETQMKDYFSQFGRVTRVRVSRSQLTGRSKGYGFVEFAHTDVAKVAAESMNNYLMCGRLVKAEYIPPEKQRNNYFRGTAWSIVSHPKIKRRMKTIRGLNSTVPDENHEIFVKNSIKKLKKLSEILKSEGIDLKMKLGDVVI